MRNKKIISTGNGTEYWLDNLYLYHIHLFISRAYLNKHCIDIDGYKYIESKIWLEKYNDNSKFIFYNIK